jgi:hypothetical protein
MLDAAFSEGGVHLVVVPVDYSENMRVLVDELHSVARPSESALLAPSGSNGNWRRSSRKCVARMSAAV